MDIYGNSIIAQSDTLSMQFGHYTVVQCFHPRQRNITVIERTYLLQLINDNNSTL